MKITAILVLRTSAASSGGGGEDQQAAVLANASDVSRCCFFRRRAARQFNASVARTVAIRTIICQTFQHEGYKVHCYNPNGLCVVVFTNDHYPDRSAYSILIKMFLKPAKNTNSYCTISREAALLATGAMTLAAGLGLTYILGKKC